MLSNLAVVLLLSPLASTDPASEVPPVRVLIVTGVDYPGHRWKETAPCLRAVLEAEGELEARIIEDHEFLASDAIFAYDVILLHLKNYDPTQRAEQVRKNLTRFVAEGGGLVLYHFACGAFPRWDGFEPISGRIWDEDKRAHDPRGPFTVEITDREHPITRDLQDFDTDDELYTCLGGTTPIRILATARSKVDGQAYPMAFVLEYGKGKVFHTPLGHDVKAVQSPGSAELIRRGCLWTAGRLK
jgi:type 1 glutamine amidotransferase